MIRCPVFNSGNSPVTHTTQLSKRKHQAFWGFLPLSGQKTMIFVVKIDTKQFWFDFWTQHKNRR